MFESNGSHRVALEGLLRGVHRFIFHFLESEFSAKSANLSLKIDIRRK